jgi:hypothetical protein
MAQFKLTSSHYVKVSRMVNYALRGVDHTNNLQIPVQRRKPMLHR